MAQYITRILAVAILLGAGCAAPLPPAQPLGPGQQDTLASCQARLVQRLCPDREDCAARVREMYAAQRPEDRAGWLKDYGCEITGP